MPETNDIVISYNGNTIATTSASGQKTIGTSGKFCTGNIIVDYTKPTSDVSWFGGIDAVKIYELTKEFALTDFTNWNEFTPSTTAFALKFPATAYSTASATSVTFDRVGKNGSTIYNNIIFDFSQYDYVAIFDIICDFKYTVDEETLGIAHVVRNGQTYISYIGQSPISLSGNIIIPSTTEYGQTEVISLSPVQASINRAATNDISHQLTAYYGLRLTAGNPSFSGSVKSFNNMYMNIPSMYVSAVADTYTMTVSAWSYVSAQDTKYKYRCRLYQVKKPNIVEYASNRLTGTMLINNTFPAD